jgi:hypothetical protein
MKRKQKRGSRWFERVCSWGWTVTEWVAVAAGLTADGEQVGHGGVDRVASLLPPCLRPAATLARPSLALIPWHSACAPWLLAPSSVPADLFKWLKRVPD